MDSKDAIVAVENSEMMNPSEKSNVLITETEVPSTQRSSKPVRPPMHTRTTTTRVFPGFEDDNLTNMGRAIYQLLEHPVIRYCIYVLPFAGILAIPLVLFATKYRSVKADGIHLLGLFVWLEVIWVSLWISKLIASALPYLFQGVCGIISTGVRKYALVLKAVEIPLSLFIWTIISYCSLNIVHVFDLPYYNANYSNTTSDNIKWLHILGNVCRGSIGSAALYLAEKVLMQIISVTYHGKQHSDKIKGIKMTSRAIDLLYEASLKLYGDHHPDFLEEDYDIHDSTNVQKLLRQYSADQRTMRVFGDIHFYGERLISAFGRMASDITGTQVFRPTATHAIVESALDRKAGAQALARRIYRSFVQPDADVIYEKDIEDALGPGSAVEAQFIFHQLDRDQNGDVSLQEMLALVTGISRTRKDMWKSACDIKNAIKVLDHVSSLLVLIIIVFVYSAFFSNFLADNWSKILVSLSAGAFSFGQTVGEFNAACILVFVKHPFDIGDRVNIENVEYEVDRISLLYTVFRRVDTDTLVQVANSVVGNLWIDNVTRSKAMKERLTFSVCPTTSFQDIENLRAELQAFVIAPENSRDFQNTVDIQLLSVGDLKQLDLRVEIRHKSNWSDETLRAYRRSKFMCGLLSAMRKVSIAGPAGPGPLAGTIENPNYSVTITDNEAKASRARFDHDREVKKQVHPALATEVSTTSSGLEILPSLSGYRARNFDGVDEIDLGAENIPALQRPSRGVGRSDHVHSHGFATGRPPVPGYAGPQHMGR